MPPPLPLTLSELASLRTQWLGPRPVEAHKGLYGPLLCLGGNQGYSGAILLAARAAQRAGAGAVMLATTEMTAQVAWLAQPELMARTVTTRSELMPWLAEAKAVVAGPGLGRDNWAAAWWPLLTTLRCPQVLDADGLFWLAENPQPLATRVITPHPGEAARLLACSTEAVQADREAAVQALQARYGGVVILKGAGTLICDGEVLRVCPFGNPGMAVPGMGDVLAGLIGALLVQDVPLLPAALLAVGAHALTADALVRDAGERGLLASDVINALRSWMNGK